MGRTTVRVNGGTLVEPSNGIEEKGPGRIPWGWLALVPISAVCLYQGFFDRKDRPDDWIDREWRGTPRVVAPGRAPSQADLEPSVRTVDGLLRTHRGEGAMRDAVGQGHDFEVHSLRISTDGFERNHPPIAIGPGRYKVTGDIVVLTRSGCPATWIASRT